MHTAFRDPKGTSNDVGGIGGGASACSAGAASVGCTLATWVALASS
eukprot:CAMPEP_0204189276 /NCGR_PEP_ID=MMETSP0361-20130328/58364_1 /ASSEMBLY_ACC=CAM_ASM_000343 /TAXON_ID=268821 /ORGANISM="Scrippsiella Hangoei, Strain SHTV-5" /LENGTH=45 /DNA_ID= /DNA_START= /DNA_END= /DNA_ORIENTATION=